MNKNELKTLVWFLKGGYSTRFIDNALGLDSKKTKGFASWKVLKKYKLDKTDVSKLFIYNEKQAKEIVALMIQMNQKGSIDQLVLKHKPSNIIKFHNTYFFCESEDVLCKALTGETKNLIQYFFTPQKKIVGICQNKNCKTEGKPELQTAHFLSERPELFKLSASKFKQKSGDLYKFDLYKIFEEFLKAHSKPKSICFLCQKCHNLYDNKVKKDKELLKYFKKNIQW